MIKKALHLLLIYPDFIEGAKVGSGGNYSEGLASISAVVKQGGHRVSLMHLDHEYNKEDFIKFFKQFKDIDLIGFSCRTTIFDYTKEMVAWVRSVNPKIFIFVGGYHAILVPDEFMKIPGIDAVCLGEGEYPTLELMDKMAAKKDYTKIKSFYFKKGNKVIKNEVAPLIEDLDELPFPDVDLFDYKNLSTTKTDTAIVMLSRGCIYSCTYCGNSQFRNVYPNKAKYARFRSPEKAIELLKSLLKKYPNIKYIWFRDAIFNMFPKWFDEFIELYTQEIKLPFTCNLRFDIVTEETVRKMKAAGCYTIDIGLESGNKEIRQKYLHRFTTDEQMINCSIWFNKYKIKVLTYNILGLPYEDLHKALETVKLNAKLKSDQVTPNIFYPYPMTKLKEIADEGGFGREITAKTRVYIKQPQFPDYQVLFAANYFMFYVRIYKWCYQKDTKVRRLIEKIADFSFTSPLTPRRTLNLIHDIKSKFISRLKRFLINRLPKLFIFLRNKKHNIKSNH
ncbi:MAG TPA: radical SAM protein [Bacilli bacterium]|nr:radical SAM protein [Bacilli bacterium]